MRRSLCSLLRCISCDRAGLSLKASSANQLEVRTGTLECPTCGKTYPVYDGIPDLIDPSDQWVAEERRHGPRTQDELRRRLGSEEALREFNRAQALGVDPPSFYDLSTRAAMDQAIELLDDPVPGSRALAIGDSSGRDLSRLFVARGYEGIALDISPFLTASDYVIESNGLYYDRLAASMTNIPLAAGQIDVCFASACVHHVEHPTRVFEEVRRVLRPGGRFVLVNERTISRLRPGHKETVKLSDEDAHESVYFYHEWTRMLQDVGFHVRPFRPRFLSYKKRLSRRIAYGSSETRWGRILRTYFRAMGSIESVFALGVMLSELNFLWERELIGDLGFSCIAVSPSPS